MNTNVINSANYGTGDRPTRHWAMSSHRSTGTAACQYLLMTLLSLMMLLGCLPAFGQADWGNITWSTGVPPGGYLSDDEKKDADTGQVFVNPNPALDFDLANDGKKNTWRIDIEIERGKPPKSFSPTDAKGEPYSSSGYLIRRLIPVTKNLRAHSFSVMGAITFHLDSQPTLAQSPGYRWNLADAFTEMD